MSVPGTRLDKLLALRSRLDHEIASERRREALADRRWQVYERPRKRRDGGAQSSRSLERGYVPQLNGGDRGQSGQSADSTRERLNELGVTSLTVKQWAVRWGYRTEIQPGRVAHDLLERYAKAHPAPRG